MCASRSTGAAVIDSPPQATSSSSASSSANDVSSMSTETTDPSSDPAVTSETDSCLDSHTSLGALACCSRTFPHRSGDGSFDGTCCGSL